MYSCVYVCMYVCMYVCRHACIYVCMYVCMYGVHTKFGVGFTPIEWESPPLSGSHTPGLDTYSESCMYDVSVLASSWISGFVGRKFIGGQVVGSCRQVNQQVLLLY